MSGKPISSRKDLKCPFYGKSLDKVCHTCALYVCVQQGDNPPAWDCSFALAPLFQLQANKTFHDGVSGLQKATESWRNEMNQHTAALMQGGMRIASQQTIPLMRNHLRSLDLIEKVTDIDAAQAD